MKNVGIIGMGRYLPERILTNSEVAERVDTSDEWIFKNIGIRERRIAAADELQYQMGAKAAMEALESCGLSPSDIDMILVTTNVPDYPIPPVSAIIQKELKADNAATADIIGACPIFASAVDIAWSLASRKDKKYVMLIATEKLSALVDWDARGLSCFLGDGAAALIFGEVPEGYGILSAYSRTIGEHWNKIYMPAGGVAERPTIENIKNKQHFIKMDGRFVKEFVPQYFKMAVNESMKAANISIDDVDLIVPHQANINLIKAGVESLGLDMSKAFTNMEYIGNVSTASVPLALYDAYKSNRINNGDIVVTPVFGAGFAYGCCVMKWYKSS